MSFGTVLIANRGAIACRIIRTLRNMGIRSVAVFSDADEASRHVAEADVAVRIGPGPAAESYLDTACAFSKAARETGADAIHPGYGFLARECRLRRGLRRRRNRLHRAEAGQYPRLRPEAQRPRPRRSARRAAGARHWSCWRMRKRQSKPRADRLSRDAEGDRRRRRHRHARLRR
jgi:hypothetical protein